MISNLERNTIELDYALLNRDAAHPWWLYLVRRFGTKRRIRTVYDGITVYTIYQAFGIVYK